MRKTLAELKAENAQPEDEAVLTPQVEAEETDGIEAVAEVAEESTDDLGEGSEDGGEAAIEAWMQTDEQASDDVDKKFTDYDIAAAKKKLRAKLEREHNTEIEQLKAELAALKGQTVQQGNVQIPAVADQMPTLEQFDFDEAKFNAAMANYSSRKALGEFAQLLQNKQRESQISQQRQKLEQSVDQHYERAAILAKETGISPDAYRSADLMVRQALEQVLPKNGDLIADQLISNMGEGSEKVWFYLGVNANARSILQSKLMEDRSGLSAAMYLGELKKEKTAPQKRISLAPKPAANASGDIQTTGAGMSKLLKKYKASTSPQERMNIKREAKAAGIDTSSWINEVR